GVLGAHSHARRERGSRAHEPGRNDPWVQPEPALRRLRDHRQDGDDSRCDRAARWDHRAARLLPALPRRPRPVSLHRSLGETHLKNSARRSNSRWLVDENRDEKILRASVCGMPRRRAMPCQEEVLERDCIKGKTPEEAAQRRTITAAARKSARASRPQNLSHVAAIHCCAAKLALACGPYRCDLCR